MKTPSIKQLAAASATAATASVAPHVVAAHQAAHQAADHEAEPVPTVRLNFDVPKDLHIAVKTKAAATGVTMKDVLIDFLREYTKK
jgi:hypothetical protein